MINDSCRDASFVIDVIAYPCDLVAQIIFEHNIRNTQEILIKDIFSTNQNLELRFYKYTC